MTKLLRIAYALWVKNESYSPEFEAKQQEEKSPKEKSPKEKSVVGPNLEVKPQRQGVTTTPSSVAPETETSIVQPPRRTSIRSQSIQERILLPSL